MSATAHDVVAAQAEDEGLWFIAETAAEAYLQQELRRLHEAVERQSGSVVVRVVVDPDDLARLRLLVSQIGFALDGYLASLDVERT